MTIVDEQDLDELAANIRITEAFPEGNLSIGQDYVKAQDEFRKVDMEQAFWQWVEEEQLPHSRKVIERIIKIQRAYKLLTAEQQVAFQRLAQHFQEQLSTFILKPREKWPEGFQSGLALVWEGKIQTKAEFQAHLTAMQYNQANGMDFVMLQNEALRQENKQLLARVQKLEQQRMLLSEQGHEWG